MDPTLVHHKLNDDLEFFAEHAPLVIKDKQGRLLPWKLNLAQRYVHDRLQAQLREKGWVRALVLKGRQQGVSTYVSGRFYHKATRNSGLSAFILSHDGEATDYLFTMVKRYHDHVQPALQPEVGKSNTREMIFPELHSDFSAATARNEQSGRGGTSQLFHGSEPAYWEYAYAIQDGALQAIALVPGTEVILESTSDGPKGLFYDKCQKAMKTPPKGDYILIFVPWFWQEEYEREPEPGFELDAEEKVYAQLHFSKPFPYSIAPISQQKILRKMAWRRAKIGELAEKGGGNIEVGRAEFGRIYPSTPAEAFQSRGVGLFRPDAIVAARALTLTDRVGARVAGVDPGGESDNADPSVISIRQGRVLEKRMKYGRMRPMELAGIVARLIVDESLDMVFVDRIGIGAGTVDRLVEMGYGKYVIGVAFSERTLFPDLYSNKRTEIICEYAKWVNGGDTSIPDDDEAHMALACIPKPKRTSSGVLALPTKDSIKQDNPGVCLDIVDADALTFSFPVQGRIERTQVTRKNGAPKSVREGGGPLRSMSRIRRKR